LLNKILNIVSICFNINFFLQGIFGDILNEKIYVQK
jgi:hypothetical protein